MWVGFVVGVMVSVITGLGVDELGFEGVAIVVGMAVDNGVELEHACVINEMMHTSR